MSGGSRSVFFLLSLVMLHFPPIIAIRVHRLEPPSLFSVLAFILFCIVLFAPIQKYVARVILSFVSLILLGLSIVLYLAVPVVYFTYLVVSSIGAGVLVWFYQKHNKIEEAFKSVETRLEREDFEAEEKAFLAAIVHDLKNPLSLIQANCELVCNYWEELEEDERKLYLKKIPIYIKKMDQSISSGLKKIQNKMNGWQAEHLQGTDVVSLLHVLIVDDIGPIVDKPVKLIVLEDRPIFANIDRENFEIAFKELLDNANAYGEGEIKISVSDLALYGLVEIQVSNLTEKIFDVDNCFQIQRRSLRNGFGLWSARNYFRGMGGDITVTQNEIKDSDLKEVIFYLELPRADYKSVDRIST